MPIVSVRRLATMSRQQHSRQPARQRTQVESGIAALLEPALLSA